MIKRRFYRDEHGDKDEQSSNSSSSSSSSDSEVEAEGAAESEDYSEGVELKEIDKSPSSSSGYESENSSADEINVDSTGCINEDDGSESDKQNTVSLQLSGKHGADVLEEEKNGLAKKNPLPDEMPDFVMKFKSVYRCRLCPRIVCLTEETMRTHLNSKRHTRSEKLLKENRLKAMLNSDGEIENQETPAEMHARIVALAQNKSKKKNKGRQRQKKRSRKKKNVPNVEKTNEATNKPSKKRRKSES